MLVSAVNRAYCNLRRFVVRFWENVKKVRHMVCFPELRSKMEGVMGKLHENIHLLIYRYMHTCNKKLT